MVVLPYRDKRAYKQIPAAAEFGATDCRRDAHRVGAPTAAGRRVPRAVPLASGGLHGPSERAHPGTDRVLIKPRHSEHIRAQDRIRPEDMAIINLDGEHLEDRTRRPASASSTPPFTAPTGCAGRGPYTPAHGHRHEHRPGADPPGAARGGRAGRPSRCRSGHTPCWLPIRDLGAQLASALGEHRVVLLQGHGVASVAATPAEAALHAIHLEHLAEANWRCWRWATSRAPSRRRSSASARRPASSGASAGPTIVNWPGARTSQRVLWFEGPVEHDPAIVLWLNERAPELGAIATTWFAHMRDCGDDVRELMHDGCPVACVDDVPFGYVDVFIAHVNVGFFRGAELDDPNGLLAGSCRTHAPCESAAGRPARRSSAAHADPRGLRGHQVAPAPDVKRRPRD